MPNILILSVQGDGIPLARKLVSEGHNVSIWFSTKSQPELRDLMIVDSLVHVDLSKYDLVLADAVGLGSICDEISKQGNVVFGGSVNDRLTTDLAYAIKVVQALSKLKVLNDEKGSNLTVEGWFTGTDFIKPFIYSFKKTRLMEGDKGPETEGMGDIIFPSLGDRITEEALPPLIPLLQRVGYRGPISVNLVLVGKELYFKSFLAQFNYDVIQAWCELLKLSLYSFLIRKTDLLKRVEYIHTPAISVRLSVSPYPYKKGVPKWKPTNTISIPEDAKKHIWLMDVNNVTGCITARGDTFNECQRRVYRTVKNIVINPDVQYRKDIGDDADRIKKDIERYCEQELEAVVDEQEVG